MRWCGDREECACRAVRRCRSASGGPRRSPASRARARLPRPAAGRDPAPPSGRRTETPAASVRPASAAAERRGRAVTSPDGAPRHCTRDRGAAWTGYGGGTHALRRCRRHERCGRHAAGRAPVACAGQCCGHHACGSAVYPGSPAPGRGSRRGSWRRSVVRGGGWGCLACPGPGPVRGRVRRTRVRVGQAWLWLRGCRGPRSIIS